MGHKGWRGRDPDATVQPEGGVCGSAPQSDRSLHVASFGADLCVPWKVPSP